MTDKSDNRVGHLNTILARGGRILSKVCSMEEVQMPGLCLGGGGGNLKFRVDWCISNDRMNCINLCLLIT